MNNKYFHKISTTRHINGINPYQPQYSSKNKKIITPNTVMTFGKYKGMVASEVFKINRSYFEWLKENTGHVIVSELLPTPNKG